MAYQVIARKYRPQQFEDVIGQSVITTTLKNAIQQKRIGHAYLFSGVRGVGKTTTARILAKALNCAKGPTATPCEECDSCREIKNGNSVDVIEIDAASNRSIDDVRQLRENVKYRPSRDRFKIYIIDEAHQLTDDAWDALLKTLEEPPDHVVFIFATTERHKLKPTILSRCQNFSFRTLSYHEVFKSLEGICATEKITITPGALSMLARSAEGSIRDAQSLLDQVISFCGNSIEEDKIRELLGFVSQEYLDRFSDALVQRDTHAALKLVDDLIRAGFDPRHFCREAIQHIRNLMIVCVAGTKSELLELPPDEIERLSSVASQFSEEDLVRYFHLLVRTENDLKWSSHPRLHLELGLTRLVEASRLMSLEEFLADLRSGKSPATSSAGSRPTTRPSPAPTDGSTAPALKKNLELNSSAPSAEWGPDFRTQPLSQAGSSPATPAAVSAAEVFVPSEENENESADVRVLRQAVFEKSKFLASLLEHASQIEIDKSTLRLIFSEANRQFYSMLNHKDQIATLTLVCQNALGKNLQVKFVLEDRVEHRTPPKKIPATAQPVPHAPHGADDIANDPSVRSFVETFRAEIVEVKKKT